MCPETQPRRGKNLPHRALDSRAKKLSPIDRDDYEFTVKWLDEFAHKVYRDKDHHIIGLGDLTEVSLCKAHSSTLYRAKKKHQGNLNQAPPSPADSNGTMMEDIRQHRSSSVDSHSHQQQQAPVLPQPMNHHFGNNGYPSSLGGGPLAAKVREISFQQQQQQHYRLHEPPESPDFSLMTASTSVKRKRTSAKLEVERPSSSASTPLFTNNNNNHSNVSPLMMNHHRHGNHHNNHHSQQPQPPTSRQPTSSFSSQLPPLHLRTPSLTSLSSTLQHQLHVTPNTFNNNHSTRHQQPPPPVFHHLPPQHKVIETVSLKSSPPNEDKPNEQEPIYFIRNLAITDTYTFQDLLCEIDFAGPPPPGKRVVISDSKRERIFPLAQAIRNVIRYPTDTHVEFYLGLTEKASIDWSNYK